MADLRGLDAGAGGTPRARQVARNRLTRRAWWAFAGLPVSFVIASLLGGWLIDLQGYDPDAAGSLPMRVLALAGIPATLVLIAPAVAAVLLGRDAMHHGEPDGRSPAIVGIVFIGYVAIQALLTIVAG